MRPPFATACLALFFWAAAAAHPAQAGAAYTLGVGDQLQLKVYEWRGAVGDVREWTALNGKFSVGADGEVSLPLIGAVPAAGHTLEELADAIGARLQKTVGLATRPRASVEVIEYRPFYILGSVNRPGEYAFRPGMTVLQAVSIAGGLYRLSDPGMLGRHGVLASTGELRVQRIELSGLLARRARLQAELGGSDLVFPRELLEHENDPGIAQVIGQERKMFAARNDALRSQTEALNKLKELLNGEVASLQAKMKNVDQELALLKQELASTSSLVQRGLAAAPREFSLRQTELQTEGRRLDLDAAALRAREDIGKADQAIIELRNKTRNEELTELAEVESKLSQTAARIRTSQMLIAEDASGQEAAILGSEIGPPLYSIVRRGGNETQEIAATDATLVEPGDTIQVKRTGATPSLSDVGVGNSTPPAIASKAVPPVAESKATPPASENKPTKAASENKPTKAAAPAARLHREPARRKD